MAHKTLIGGTEYEISGGKTLVGGTAYKISGGKTLVEGTSKDISFKKPVTVSLTSTGNSPNCCIVHNSVTYYSKGSSFVCYAGDEITIYTSCGKKVECNFVVNGVLVSRDYTHSYTVPSDISNISVSFTYVSSGTQPKAHVYFTTS